MAFCITEQWSNDYTPQLKLTVTEKSTTHTTSTLSWKLEYITHGYAVNTESDMKYSVFINGVAVAENKWTTINQVTGTKSIKSGTLTVDKTKSTQSIEFSVWANMNFTWSGVWGGEKTATGTVDIAALTSYSVLYKDSIDNKTLHTQTKWYNEPLTLWSTTPSRDGHTFQKWLSNDSDIVYKASDVYSDNTNLILYAQWQAHTLVVTYYANGGTFSTYNNDSDTVVGYYGQTYNDGTLVDAIGYYDSVKPGYHLQSGIEWNTVSDGSGISISDSQLFNSTESLAELLGVKNELNDHNVQVNLYANWKPNTYRISYNTLGGTGVTDITTASYNVESQLTDSIPTKTGNHFVSWGLDDSSIGTITDNNITITKQLEDGEQITLYAIWALNCGTIYFYNSLESTEPSLRTIDFNYDSTNIDLPYVSELGFSQAGHHIIDSRAWWNGDLSNPIYLSQLATNLSSFVKDQNNVIVNLYANWNRNTYNIIYYCGDDTEGTEVTEVTTTTALYGQESNLTTQIPIKGGNEFRGWYSDSEEISIDNTSKTIVVYVDQENNSNITITALWDVLTYTLSYNTLGGSPTISDQTCVSNEDVSLSTTFPSISGYTFNGWSKNLNGTLDYYPGDTIQVSSDTTLYAVYTLNNTQIEDVSVGLFIKVANVWRAVSVS